VLAKIFSAFLELRFVVFAAVRTVNIVCVIALLKWLYGPVPTKVAEDE
jgi:hypothetical protein